MAREPHPKRGQTVVKTDCAECGKTVSVKVNKNGICYYSCEWPNVETGIRCSHHVRYSRPRSEKLIARQTQPKPETKDDRRKPTAGGGGDEDRPFYG